MIKLKFKLMKLIKLLNKKKMILKYLLPLFLKKLINENRVLLIPLIN